MAQPTPHQTPATVRPGRQVPWQLALAVVGLGAALFAAIALWFHYGTAVFFETIATGISNCF